MNVLLDNCVHRRVRSFFHGHAVRTARQAGLAELENGDLLAAAAAAGFDVLITTDKNIAFQHNLDHLPLPVMELAPRDTRWAGLVPLGSHCAAAMASIAEYRFVRVHPDGTLDRFAPRPATP